NRISAGILFGFGAIIIILALLNVKIGEEKPKQTEALIENVPQKVSQSRKPSTIRVQSYSYLNLF
ncbi:MAG: hypothetical protein ABI378_08055, partial [Chitinophagaceae bacterium]